MHWLSGRLTVMRGRSRSSSRPDSVLRMRSLTALNADSPVVSPSAATRSARAGLWERCNVNRHDASWHVKSLLANTRVATCACERSHPGVSAKCRTCGLLQGQRRWRRQCVAADLVVHSHGCIWTAVLCTRLHQTSVSGVPSLLVTSGHSR